jgi:hypothetical protein
MKHYPLILVLSLVYPMARGAEAEETSETTRVVQSSEPGTSVVVLPGARPIARPVTAKRLAAAETRPSAPGPASAEGSIYFPKLIGTWKLADARRILGRPTHQRPSRESDQTVSGQIYAFPDPTNRYKEVELQFDQADGKLSAVFMYPAEMTWKECRRLWGMNVDATEAGKGRTFYSYNNRHLDILVDTEGKVISLGLY